MLIFPAIDIYEGRVVRLEKGDYARMTVYGEDPVAKAAEFAAAGAKWLHLVDLEGARTGETPNLEVISRIAAETGMKTEVGGGIRSEETVRRYLDAGISRVILGTAAARQPRFLADMLSRYGERIAVGADLKDGYVATHGWTEKADLTAEDFFRRICDFGGSTVICTDISRDGMLGGANRELYRDLMREYHIDIVASGGVSDLADIRALYDMKMYGAILGRALYEGRVDLREALQETEMRRKER